MAAEAIFIGYRRDDTADVAGRIYDAMAQRFGKQRVFKDVDNIGPGIDFGNYIKTVLPRCLVVLVLIGPNWLGSKDETGKRRLDDDHDWVRIEIETALATSGVLVVPILVNGARMPRGEEVPDSLTPLLRRNAAIIRRDPDFHDDVERLATAIRSSVDSGILDLSKIGGDTSASAPAAEKLWNELKDSIDPERLRRFAESFPGSTAAFEARERAAYLDQADKAHRELASTFMSQDAFQRAQNEAVHHHNADLLISLADRLRKDASRLLGFMEAWPQHPLLVSLKEQHQSLLATIKYINSVVPVRREFERAQTEAARNAEVARKEAARLAAKEAERVRLEQIATNVARRRDEQERSEAAAKRKQQHENTTAAWRMVAETIWLCFFGLFVWLIYEGLKNGVGSYQEFLGLPLLFVILMWIWIGTWKKPFERLGWVAGMAAFFATVFLFLSSQGRL